MVSQFYCFVLVLLIVFDLSSSSTLTSNNFAKHHVRIINNLNNKLLNYHCKSGDDDLGIRTLQPKGEWEFSFRLHWIASTLFYCYFWYDNFYAAFDVYSAYLAKVCGGNNYYWTVQEDGFYLYNTYLNTNWKIHDWSK